MVFYRDFSCMQVVCYTRPKCIWYPKERWKWLTLKNMYFLQGLLFMIFHDRSGLLWLSSESIVQLVPKAPLKLIYRPKCAFLYFWHVVYYDFFHANSLLRLIDYFKCMLCSPKNTIDLREKFCIFIFLAKVVYYDFFMQDVNY